MADHDTRPLLAIINTSEEISKLLERIFSREGFRTVTVYVPDLKRNDPGIAEFLKEHDPAVIVWDIAIPYEENWEFFRSIRDSPLGRRQKFVLTTTNKPVLDKLIGPTNANELIGKPFDLEEIVKSVRRAIEAGESA